MCSDKEEGEAYLLEDEELHVGAREVQRVVEALVPSLREKKKKKKKSTSSGAAESSSNKSREGNERKRSASSRR